MSDVAQQFKNKPVPPQAFRVPVGPLQFAASKKNEDGLDITPFSMLARSTEPVQHWYWGAIYHDFSGMQVNDRIPIDYVHDDKEILGFGDSFPVDKDGLHVAGHVVHFKADDRATEVVKKNRAGVPYEASIDFRGNDILAEEVGPSNVAMVNGQQIKGPALIFRQWPLRGMAVCPHGMDPNTSTQFSQDDDKPVMVRIFTQSEGETMSVKTSDKPADTAPATQQSDKGGANPPPAVPQQQGQEPPPKTLATDPAAGNRDVGRTQYGVELKQFTDRFGSENGTKWFLENKTYSEALELHNETLQKQLAANEAEKKQLADKLQGLKSGEDAPASFSEDSSAPGKPAAVENRYAHLGRIGTFASSLKLPTKKS